MPFDLGYPPHQANFARPRLQGTSLQHFHDRFPDEAACLRYVFTCKFGERPVCPTCGVRCNWGMIEDRRLLMHRRCKTAIFPYARTAMSHSRMPSQLWFYAMLHMANSNDSVNAYFICRHLGMSLRASQRMIKRIRLHLAAIDHASIIGTPGADVTIRLERLGRVVSPMSSKRNVADVLFTDCNGWIDSFVVNRSRPHRVRQVIATRIEPNARLVTDCYQTARIVSAYGRYRSPTVAFLPRGAADNPDYDRITAFLSSFRRAFRQQHQTITLTYLWLFLREYQFRFNRRGRSKDTFWDIVGAFPDVSAATETALRAFYSDPGV